MSFSIWGMVVLMLIAAGAAWLLVKGDRKMWERYERSVLSTLLLTAVAGVAALAVCKVGRWWADMLWWLLLVGVSALLVVRRLRCSSLKLLGAVALSMLLTSLTVGSVLLWAVSAGSQPLSHSFFVAVTCVMVFHLFMTMRSGMQAYLFSLRHTVAHRQYLLANGATHLESLMPSIGRALRAALLPAVHRLSSPVLVSMPMLLAGMLVGDVPPLSALTFALLLVVACLSSTVIAMTAAMWLADRCLFDRHDQLLV